MAGDFRIGPNSPCVNAGLVIANINDGGAGSTKYSGSAPDIGYYEFNLQVAQWAAYTNATGMGSGPLKLRVTWVELGNPKETEVR